MYNLDAKRPNVHVGGQAPQRGRPSWTPEIGRWMSILHTRRPKLDVQIGHQASEVGRPSWTPSVQSWTYICGPPPLRSWTLILDAGRLKLDIHVGRLATSRLDARRLGSNIGRTTSDSWVQHGRPTSDAWGPTSTSNFGPLVSNMGVQVRTCGAQASTSNAWGPTWTFNFRRLGSNMGVQLQTHIQRCVQGGRPTLDA